MAAIIAPRSQQWSGDGFSGVPRAAADDQLPRDLDLGRQEAIRARPRGDIPQRVDHRGGGGRRLQGTAKLDTAGRGQ